MNRFKDKFLLAVIGGVFALFLGLNVYSFSRCLETPRNQVAWVVEKSAPAEVLEDDSLARQLCFRLRQTDETQGDGRGLVHFKTLRRIAQKFGLPFGLQVTSVNGFEYGAPKDYFIYTLKRILC